MQGVRAKRAPPRHVMSRLAKAGAGFQGLCQGAVIQEIQLTANRHTMGKAGDFKLQRLQSFMNVMGCRLTLDSG